MTKVGITCSKDYSQVKDKIEEVFNIHGGARSFINSGDMVLIKPNLLVAPRGINDPVVTDPRMILGIAEFLVDYGAKVFIGDSPAFGTVKGILTKLSIADKLTSMGVNIVEFTNPDKRFNGLDKAISAYDKVINLPKLKVHIQLLLTSAVKNLYGFVSGKRKAWFHFAHGDKLNHFAEMLIKNYQNISPTFTIVDAITVMNKKGPRGGEPKDLGLLFSGVDCVAIDRVVTSMLGIDIEDYRILRAAKDLDIGQWRLENIEILGDKVSNISLDYPSLISISFSPIRILKSVIKNILINRKQKKNISLVCLDKLVFKVRLNCFPVSWRLAIYKVHFNINFFWVRYKV
jgi:uncharacterized protein (DUF362 family)